MNLTLCILFILGGSRSGGSGSCVGDECSRNGIIIGSVLGGAFGIAAAVFATICFCKRCKGKPLRPNPVFVNQPAPKDQTYEKDHFENGTWSSQYQQYNTWHGPHQCSLTFDRGTNQIAGAGHDDVGQFTVDGTFSIETHRMALTKTYQLGTGNRAENSGHQVTLQLTWNSTTNQFEGKWYVQTNKYQGDGDFQLKFKDHAMINFEKITF